MSTYTFLTKRQAEGPTTYYATTKTIEIMSIGDTYDRHGNKIDADEVGEYEVKGFNFWNGNNWQTILVDTECGEAEYCIVTDSELITVLVTAIDARELIEDKGGIQQYTGGDYCILHSRFASEFSTWELIPSEEYNFVTKSYNE